MYSFTRTLSKASWSFVVAAIVLCAGISIALADDATTTQSVASSTPSSTLSDSTATSTESDTLGVFQMSTSTTDVIPTLALSTSTTASSSVMAKPVVPPPPTRVQVDCKTAYTAEVYDTPSGHLDPGFILATSSESIGPAFAHLLGMQSWADCADANGEKYEIKLTPQEYAGLERPGAAMPSKLLDLSKTSTFTLLSVKNKMSTTTVSTTPAQTLIPEAIQEVIQEATTTETTSTLPQENNL